MTKGRPTLFEHRMQRIQVMLDEETLQRIDELPGNRSEVIRNSVAFVHALRDHYRLFEKGERK